MAASRTGASNLPLTAAEAGERLRGILFFTLGLACFSLLDTSAKYASAFVPTIEVVWLRYAIALIIAVAVLRPWRNFAAYVARRPVAQMVRALFLALSTAFNFVAIHHLQLAETVSISFAAPLIITALAGPLLGEWAGPRRWAAIVVGFVGVLIVVRPTPAAFNPAALFSVGAALGYAGYNLTTRMLSATETSVSLLIYGSLVPAILLTVSAPPFSVMPPGWLVAVALAMTGAMATLGHWFVIRANAHAPATVLAPFAYTQIIWMILLGYTVFGDVPDIVTLVGAAIVVSSGLYVLYRERVHRDR
jgi:drug/metabolite transporter (DMT)-like permease